MATASSFAAFPCNHLLLTPSFLNHKVLGTPTKDELKSMNPNYQEFKFPQIRAYPWGSIFKPSTPPESIDLIGKLLAYVPDKRLKAIEVRSCLQSQTLWRATLLGTSLRVSVGALTFLPDTCCACTNVLGVRAPVLRRATPAGHHHARRLAPGA